MTSRIPAISAAALAAFLQAAPAWSKNAIPAPFAGVNLSIGEFAAERIPGRFGFDYLYPDEAMVKPFLDSGMTAVRVPVLWERLQLHAGEPLIPEEVARLDASLRALGRFQTIILDIHNFGAFRGTKITATPDGIAAFADLWAKLAAHYKNRRNIAFGLMNEPNGVAAADWRKAAEAAVGAIRRTGARNMILVPGTEWTGARTWVGGDRSNAAAYRGFRDPGSNAVFEMHLYLDADGSGTSPICVSENVGVERLRAATAWLRTNHYRGYLGEFGAGPGPTCVAALDNLLRFMNDNGDVWVGWTYWSAGPWWGNYFQSVQPGPDGKPKPQWAALLRHIPPAN